MIVGEDRAVRTHYHAGAKTAIRARLLTRHRKPPDTIVVSERTDLRCLRSTRSTFGLDPHDGGRGLLDDISVRSTHTVDDKRCRRRSRLHRPLALITKKTGATAA